MELPQTTPEKPFIEFRIDVAGNLKLSATSHWWGGKKEGFTSSNGSEGNSCLPEKLKEYIEYFKERRIKKIKKEIITIRKQLQLVKAQNDLLDF